MRTAEPTSDPSRSLPHPRASPSPLRPNRTSVRPCHRHQSHRHRRHNDRLVRVKSLQPRQNGACLHFRLRSCHRSDAGRGSGCCWASSLPSSFAAPVRQRGSNSPRVAAISRRRSSGKPRSKLASRAANSPEDHNSWRPGARIGATPTAFICWRPYFEEAHRRFHERPRIRSPFVC